MTRNPCKRSWEVEAFEDGRLSDKDRASFERHLDGCRDCTQALERLRTLGTLLAESPIPDRTELDHRRARADLLGRANDGIVGETRVSRRWLALVALAPVLVAVLFVVARWRTPPPSPPPVAASPPPSAPVFEVIDVDRADFTTERVDALSRVALRAGSASFHVEHVKPGARFLVVVPDGEVEVRGTRFVVDVADGHTRSVSVTEGVVAVRIDGSEVVLHAGEKWPRADAVAAPTITAMPPPSASSGAAVATTRALPGPRFAAAMTAYNAGDYGEAERLFIAFVREYPGDTRAEDAMFLLADARSRRGDAAGAKEAARAYLRRFPNGLRAPAAARLAGDAPSPPRP